MKECIKAVFPRVADGETRKAIYGPMIRAFENEDCDTLDDARGIDPCYDMALDAAHPEFYDDKTEKD